MVDARQIHDFDFGGSLPAPDTGAPERICVHRNGNLGAGMHNTLKYGRRAKTFTIHRGIDDNDVWRCLEVTQHAYHIRESRMAAAKGFAVLHPAVSTRKRGDIHVIGIECADVEGGGPGQEYSLSQKTRNSLVYELADLINLTPSGVTVEKIGEHAHYDPWTRAHDVGDALWIPDLRLDVTDVLEGREPWRTTQIHAFGRPADPDWMTEEAAESEFEEVFEEVTRDLDARIREHAIDRIVESAEKIRQDAEALRGG
jgi:hypothetical protein